jgi:A/G-specific adenine glycosylase
LPVRKEKVADAALGKPRAARKKNACGLLPVIASKLVLWFGKHRRFMPWRETRDAYRIWVSEIMLQQTQVATVIPYYDRFVARFPDVRELAAAPLDDVLKLWSGLGYYSRARNLHRGAQMVAARFGGEIPRTRELISEVPGIGPYTAGAILSIAYGLPEPLVDGNVARVLARLMLLPGDYRKAPAKEQVWSRARELARAGASLPASASNSNVSGDLNQALMELGATVCAPRSPDCGHCPLAKECLARKDNVQEQYPELVKKASSPVWPLRAWIVSDSAGNMLFAQRQPDGLFGGLWEVPTERRREGAAGKSAAKKHLLLTHVLTHRVLAIEVCCVSLSETRRWRNPARFPCWSGAYVDFRWLNAGDALTGQVIGLPSIQKKILRAIRQL